MNVNHDWRKHCTKKRVEDPRYCQAPALERGTWKEIFPLDPLILFNNPAVVIQFGACSILRHLVENVGIDINALDWASFSKDGEKRLILSVATHYSEYDSECLEYLLSRNNINLSLPIYKGGSLSAWTTVFIDAPVELFETMLQHPGFDINGTKPNDGAPYLFLAAFLCSKQNASQSRLLKFQAMLDAGPNPSLCARVLGAARYSLEQDGEDTEQWKKVIQIIEAVLRNGSGNA